LPWYVFRLIASPISMVMHVKMRQPLMLVLTISGLLIRVAPICVVLVYRPGLASITYAVSSATFYAGLAVVYMAVAGVPRRRSGGFLGRTIAMWSAVGFVAYSVARLI